MNLIFITADEMRGDAPSFMVNPNCKTPNIDRLAERGVRFRNHFYVHGKCVPSRAAMMTGRYCHTDGFRTVNHTNQIPPGTPNLLTALKHGAMRRRALATTTSGKTSGETIRRGPAARITTALPSPTFSPATPFSAPFAPTQWLFQGPPAESKLLQPE